MSKQSKKPAALPRMAKKSSGMKKSAAQKSASPLKDLPAHHDKPSGLLDALRKRAENFVSQKIQKLACDGIAKLRWGQKEKQDHPVKEKKGKS